MEIPTPFRDKRQFVASLFAQTQASPHDPNPTQRAWLDEMG
jgi:hypothetical protein